MEAHVSIDVQLLAYVTIFMFGCYVVREMYRDVGSFLRRVRLHRRRGTEAPPPKN